MTRVYGASIIKKLYQLYNKPEKNKRTPTGQLVRTEDMKPSRQIIFTKPDNEKGKSSMK
jgi:hypothetical protein